MTFAEAWKPVFRSTVFSTGVSCDILFIAIIGRITQKGTDEFSVQFCKGWVLGKEGAIFGLP